VLESPTLGACTALCSIFKMLRNALPTSGDRL
jgi:hypothetical protein